ncbi:MAG: TonB-dependent receptor, partial [Chakrabartia sp.]
LSGTADLRTVRPLEFGKRAIAVNLRGEVTSGKKLNDDVRNYGGRFSASYIDQNKSGTFGWAIGYAHLDAPSQTQHVKGYNYETFGGAFVRGRISPDAADTATFLTGQEIFATSRLSKRDAVIGILEWQPSDRVHTTVDLYYSKFKQRETTRGIQWFSNVWADNQNFTNVGTASIGGTQVAVTGTATGVAPIVRNDYNTRKDELLAGGINNEFQMTDTLKFIADLSYSRNVRDETITETYAGFGTGATAATQNANRVFDSLGWDITGALNGDFPQYTSGLNYADAARVSLGDRAPWGGWGHDGQTKAPHVRESIYAIDLGLEYDVEGFFDSFDVGMNFTRRKKTKTVDEFDLMLKNGRAQTLVGSQYLTTPTSLGFAGFGNVLSVNLPSAIGQFYDKVVFANADTFDKAWGLNEEVLTLRAKATINSGNLRGNIGIQWVDQRQESNGSAINTTLTPLVVSPVVGRAHYSDLLPSMNLVYDLGGGHRLRLAAAKVMARPRIDDMRASFVPSFGNPCGGSPPCVPGQTVNPWSARGGNPQIEPWRAKAVDLAYEWYIGKASYISIAGFYKKLDTYIFNLTSPFDFSGLPLPPRASNIPAGVIISPIGQITQPRNGKGGEIKGIELSGALEFGKITSLLDGFGFLGSYSYTKTNLHPLALNAAGNNQVQVNATRIPGLSPHVYSLTGYFEKWGFSARANYRYRSAFKGEVVQLFAARGFTEILADKDVSAQIGYTFQEGSSLAGLGILLQGNNLTNSAYRTRLGLDSGGAKTADGSFLPETTEKYGRQILFGVNYRF